jgi:TonB-linked SusC/RagA family outer membrane protein
MENVKHLIKGFVPVLILLFLCNIGIYAQSGISIRGTVVDKNNEAIIGASVIVKGRGNTGTVSDLSGQFTLTVPNSNTTIVISYIGMKTKEMKIGNSRNIKVTLEEDNAQLNEVVVVGYGQQKKASVVGAITQTDAKTLERYSGVPSLGQALTGNLPGVITSSSTGMPGEEDPKIIIRAQTSWNNSDPLVLVDGVERPMNTVDIASVESISVLKDASATAVYGVKGANGVILITTKRGHEGKASVHVKANATMKVVSKLPEKFDSYDTFMLLNQTVERELAVSPNAWGSYKPKQIINKYRYPANQEEWDRYPNVDWQSELFNDYAMSYNSGADISGGTKFVKYFAAVDFVHEGDLFKTFKNTRGYTSGFGYNRINMRANLDFNLTKTTKFSANLFGSNGVRHFPWGQGSDASAYWASVYHSAPDAMRPVYSDGTYGWYAPRNADVPNSVASLATSGDEKKTNTQITTDFILQQQLDMITKGLNFKASLSFDNTMIEESRGINDLYNDPQRKWINPDTGEVTYQQSEDYTETVNWSTQGGSVNTGATYRRLYYQLQLNYARQFGKHDVTAMGLFSREKYATGSEFYHYREDWVFRATYNYAMRYFAEINGAYNGSEKFSSDKRFAFFPSVSAGWMITEEPLLKSITKYVDMLKVRASWGRIGDDNVSGRWLYKDTYTYGGNTQMGNYASTSPYTIYTQSQLGNTNVSWETVEKRNLGFDFAFLKGLIAGSFDIFKDKRSDILIAGSSRAIPSYFGATAPSANLGEVESHGYEMVIRLNKAWNRDFRTWANFNMTHAVNKINFADDPELKAAYLKSQGYSINQVRSYLDYGYITSWDDLYGSTERETNNSTKLPGDYQVIDFNGDGKITSDDKAPYQYTSTPQNTFSTTVGAEWKGLSITLQFYGVTNVTREVTFPTFQREAHVAFNEGSYWTVADQSGSLPLPRWTTTVDNSASGTRYYYDGAYLRLKNAEIAYTFHGNWVKRMKLNTLRVYLNGDNLLLWTDMPDDRESNFSGYSSSGAYPTVRRFNLGMDITF